MINMIAKLISNVRNIFDPEPLPVARHAERVSLAVCARAYAYVREHEALTDAIRESRAMRRPGRLVRARAAR